MLALRVLFAAVRQVGGHLAISFASNVGAVLLSLPLMAALSIAARLWSLSLLPLGVALLLGVLPNPALAGLQMLARSLAGDEPASIREQLEALKRYWRPAGLAWLLGIAITVVIVVNLRFYAQLGASPSWHVVAGPLMVVWSLVFLVWLAMHLYVYPLLLRQERPGVWLAYRNAAVIVAGKPVFTLAVALFWLGWLLLAATTGPAYLIGLALAAAIQENALSRILPSFVAA